jgi:hypothetical protein
MKLKIFQLSFVLSADIASVTESVSSVDGNNNDPIWYPNKAFPGKFMSINLVPTAVKETYNIVQSL